MTHTDHISDEALTAFLDGEADDALRRQIEQAVAADPVLAARLDALRFDLGAVREAFDTLLSQAPAALVPDRQLRQFPWRVGGALAACLFIGAVAGYLLTPKQPSPGWMAYVASYQALYVNETLSEIDVEASTAQANLTRLSDILGRDLEGATGIPDLQFKRSQLLGFNGNPLVQLAYLSPAGDPLALCIIKKEEAAGDITSTTLEGMPAASWSDGQFAYLLIGGQDADLVARSAAFVREQL